MQSKETVRNAMFVVVSARAGDGTTSVDMWKERGFDM